MEEVGYVDLLPDRRLTLRQKVRRWYARHVIDILDTIFLFNIGLLLLTLIYALGGLFNG